MAGEKDHASKRPTTSSTNNEKIIITSDSDEESGAGRTTESSFGTDQQPSYASIKPGGTSSNTMAPITHSRSNKSARSTGSRSLSLVRSQNGFGIDDPTEDEDPSTGSDDPEAAVHGQQGATKKLGGGAGAAGGRTPSDPFEVYFEQGNADPWCPRSLPTPRKWLILVLATTGSFCVTCASSIYTSSYTQMDAELRCSHIVATLGLSMFVLGLALGPVWSPLSEFYGRRPIYLASFAAFTIFIVPCAVARNIQTVIITRFFQGLSGSAFLSVSGGTVSDLFTPEKMHHPMTLFTAAPFLAPSMGPLIGGFINSNVNWRWTHYVLIIWAFCMLMAIFFLVPETYHPVILRKKAQQKRKGTGDERWKAPIEKSNKSMVRTVGYSLLRPFQINAYEPMALILNIYSAILLGILYLFFGAFPLVFEGIYGFSLWQTGLTFLGMLFGMMAGALSNGLFIKVRARLLEKNGGKLEPEFRLPSVIVGSIFVTIGLFWFAWGTLSHWIMPIIGSGIFGLGVILCFSGTFTYLVETYPLYAASALAANALVRCAFAAAFPLFGTQMYETLGDQWATSLLGFLTAAMLPFPYIFFRFGKRIRAHSRMASAD
ncbi:unnamed protein product [Discula destructiva]